MDNSRLTWIDSLKGVGILAVILGHLASPLTRFLYSWHIPLFFFVSGYLLNTQPSLKKHISKDLLKLMLPYFIFGLLGILAEVLKRSFWPGYSFFPPAFSLSSELSGLFIWMDITHLHQYGFVLWFLPALFWARLVTRLFCKYFRHPLFIMALSLLLWFLLANRPLLLPFVLDKGLMSTIFLVSGHLFRKHWEKTWPKFIWLALAALFIFIPPPILDLAYKTASHPLINLIYALSIIGILIQLQKAGLEKLTWLSFLGTNSLFLYVIHPYVNNLSFIITIQTLGQNWIWEFTLSVIILLALLKLKKYVAATSYARLVNWI